MLEISHIGHSCFKIKGKELSLVIDPYDPKSTGYKLPKLSADVVAISHNHEDHNYVNGVGDHRLVIDSPGEYELNGVFINGIDTFHDEVAGGKRGRNLIYLIEIDGVAILHLGDLGHELSDETLEGIPSVDILLIPVGGVYTIDAATASTVISSIEPAIVVPMHYQTKDLTKIKLNSLDEFLEEMGVEDSAKKVEKLKISSRSDIPEETEVVIIEPSH